MSPEMAKILNRDSPSGRAAPEKADPGRCAIQAYEIAGNNVSCRIAWATDS